MNKSQIQATFALFKQQNPHPTTELNYSSPFELLVAVVLSAQSQDKQVNLATKPLFAVANTPELMVKLTHQQLEKYLSRLGLYRNKAKHVHTLSQQLIDHHRGEVPTSHQDLQGLAGVGRKTANVIRNTLFQLPEIAVDTHIFRVANRMQLAPGKTPLAVERGLQKRIPKDFLLNAHHWLILHGRYTCTAKSPKCHACLVADLCPYPKKTPHV